MNGAHSHYEGMLFRWVAALLLTAGAIGIWWQHHPPGVTIRHLMHGMAFVCPVAVPAHEATVADSAYTFDKAGLSIALDTISPATASRCTGALRERNRTNQRG